MWIIQAYMVYIVDRRRLNWKMAIEEDNSGNIYKICTVEIVKPRFDGTTRTKGQVLSHISFVLWQPDEIEHARQKASRIGVFCGEMCIFQVYLLLYLSQI